MFKRIIDSIIDKWIAAVTPLLLPRIDEIIDARIAERAEQDAANILAKLEA